MGPRSMLLNLAEFSLYVKELEYFSFDLITLVQGYHGAAVGKGRQLAKTELEKLKLAELSTREAVIEAARMFVLL